MRAIVSLSVPGRRLSPCFSVRAEAATFAPSIARRTAIASPIPRLAPVTSATLPFSVPLGFTRALIFSSFLLCGLDRRHALRMPRPAPSHAGARDAQHHAAQRWRMEPHLVGRDVGRALRRPTNRHPGVGLPRLSLDVRHSRAFRERHVERRAFARVVPPHRLLFVDRGDDLEAVQRAFPEKRQHPGVAEGFGGDRGEVPVVEAEGVANLADRGGLVGGEHGCLIKKVQVADGFLPLLLRNDEANRCALYLNGEKMLTALLSMFGALGACTL